MITSWLVAYRMHIALISIYAMHTSIAKIPCFIVRKLQEKSQTIEIFDFVRNFLITVKKNNQGKR